MKYSLFLVLILLISSCRVDTATKSSDYLSRPVEWDSLAGTYQMDKTSLEIIGQSNDSKWYVVINKDTSYTVNRFIDNQRKIYNSPYKKNIKVLSYLDGESKKKKISYDFNFDDFNYESQSKKEDSINALMKKDFGLDLMEQDRGQVKFFILMSFFPSDGSEYALKFEKISHIPMSLEELEKTNR